MTPTEQPLRAQLGANEQRVQQSYSEPNGQEPPLIVEKPVVGTGSQPERPAEPGHDPVQPIEIERQIGSSGRFGRDFDSKLLSALRRIEAEQRRQRRELEELRQRRITHLVKDIFDRQSERMTRLDDELQELRRRVERRDDG